MITRTTVACAMALLASSHGATPAPSAYADEESRDIKALSAEDVSSLLSGKGMGLAKAAELNGYPGPAHVLELSTELDLSQEQRELTDALFASMQGKAIVLGRALVEEERRLDRLFADEAATPARVSATLATIGALQAQLRGVHLEAHLAQARILTPEQRARYAVLRGYEATHPPSGSGMQHEH